MRVFVMAVCMVLMGVQAMASPMGDAFSEYQEALAAGDIARADTAGEKAWQLAEQNNKSQYIPILAYNLAEMRARYEPGKDAMTPAKRAMETAPASDGGLPVQKAALLVAALDAAKNPDRKNIRALQTAHKAFSDAGLPSDYAEFAALYRLLIALPAQKKWSDAAAAGDRLIQVYHDLGFQQNRMLAAIQIATGSAYLHQRRRNLYNTAYRHFIRAAAAVSGHDYPNVPKESYQALAWASTAKSLIYADGLTLEPVPDVQFKTSPGEEKMASCPAIEWSANPDPQFPNSMAQMNYVGGMILLYDIGSEGKPTNIRIAAQVPTDDFGKYAVFGLEKWQVSNSADMPDYCRKNREQAWYFTYEPEEGFSHIKRKYRNNNNRQ